MKMQKPLLSIRLSLLTAAALNLATLFAADSTPNQLSEEDKKGGWKLLFDGKTTNGWRGAKQKSFPAKGWEIQDGWLHCLGKGGGDFVTEKGSTIGHEYQLIDDEKHPDAKLANGKRVTASFYDVLKPERPPPTKKPGEINNSRIVVKGNGVEHW